MWGEMDWPAVLVADVAAVKPTVKRTPVGAAADRQLAVGVGQGSGEQHRDAAGPAGKDVPLLLGEELLEFLIDGHQRFPLNLVVVVAQVGGTVGVDGQAAEGEHVTLGQPG